MPRLAFLACAALSLSAVAEDEGLCTLEDLEAHVMMLQTSKGLSNPDNSSHETAAAEANLTLAVAHIPAELLGTTDCPCIGITNLTGELTFSLNGTDGSYPAEVGSYCGRWDHGHNPSCLGKKAPLLDPAFCLEPWCFVDPCNCKLPGGAVPKLSATFPEGKSQGHRLYYSYEACGGRDTWTATANAKACVNAKTSQACFAMEGCAWTLDRGCLGKELAGSACQTSHVQDAMTWGLSDCSCVGFSGVEGYVNATLTERGLTFKYPADVGGTCKAWDEASHPDCVSPTGAKPDWCGKRWCMVDPCKCQLETPPKVSAMFPESYWLGHQVYYSYAACGDDDSYTAGQNPTACVLQKDEASCVKQSKCAWTLKDQSYTCLGKDLATLCFGADAVKRRSATGGAWHAGSMAGSLLSLLLAAALPGVW